MIVLADACVARAAMTSARQPMLAASTAQARPLNARNGRTNIPSRINIRLSSQSRTLAPRGGRSHERTLAIGTGEREVEALPTDDRLLDRLRVAVAARREELSSSSRRRWCASAR